MALIDSQITIFVSHKREDSKTAAQIGEVLKRYDVKYYLVLVLELTYAASHELLSGT
jgi:hypothetical protein